MSWVLGLAVGLGVTTPLHADGTDALLFRIFLTDGNSMVSYGEFARVGDRVVFSLPLGVRQGVPRLHLVSIPAAAVDWSTTDRYADSARYAHYVATAADSDYAQMNADVAESLNQIALTPDTFKRLALAEGARKALIGWPAAHFGYRAEDVRQMTALLDEVIYELRAGLGMRQFALSLVATAADAPRVAMLPAPSLQQTIEQVLTATRLADTAAERVSLLRSATGLVAEGGSTLSPPWVTSIGSLVRRQLEDELATDRAYATLTRGALARADARAASADVRGVEGVVKQVVKRNDALGRRRPQEMATLMGALESRLEAARRLRLGRDQAIHRRALSRTYGRTFGRALEQMAALGPALDDIRAMAGPPQAALTALARQVDGVRQALARTAPPFEIQSIHATFLTALQLADQAGRIRGQAVVSGDLRLARDASSAAAGALMLMRRAREDLDRFARMPVLR